MNNSTDGVTLYAAFIQDVLKNYQDIGDDYQELLNFTKGYDISQPFNKIPMKVYNDMCSWIEENLGKFNLIRVGRNIGETAYQSMLENKLFASDATPHEIMKGLVVVASQMIQDTSGRGWVIVDYGNNYLIMQRTQTFNSILQLGLLDGLIRKTGASGIKVEYVKEVANGDEYDEYKISWI
ncbi:MAG: hypothetical protein EAZ31_00905 [Cytophagia bacterium]|nr:MAG: hypothetical protein EAZ31_00905 [Cytophagia bacterium]